MTKDIVANAFAAKGEGARDILRGLKSGARDALDLVLSDAPEDQKNQNRYRYVREQIFPLLQRIEDEGERDAILDDIAADQRLKVGNLKKALTRLEEETREKPEQEQKEEDSLVPAPGTEQHERAMELLKCIDILEKAAQDMEMLGHVGERRTKKLALACSVSARAGRPIQPSTHAQSSAGKNFLWDTVTSFLPPESVIRRSGVTAKALFRTQADLRGAVLYIQEVVGSEDADFSIRVLQSDGRLAYESTEKMSDGNMGTVVYEKEGPCVVVQTTTNNHLHPENETRVFPIYIDESEEQTRLIVDKTLEAASGSGISSEEREEMLEPWRDAIRLLEPAEIVIPYATRISMPSSQIRIRRDVQRLLDVIWVISWMHQYQRERDERGRILATEDDFHTALDLVRDSLTRAWRVLTPAEEKVLEAIKGLPEAQRSKGFTRRDLEVPDLSDRRLNEVLKSLADNGRLDCNNRKGPQGYTYTLARDDEKIDIGISLRPSPDEAESPANQANATEREPSAYYRPIPDAGEDSDPYREAGENGRDLDLQVETADLQQKPTTERSDTEELDVDKVMAGWNLDEAGRKKVLEIKPVLRDFLRKNPEYWGEEFEDIEVASDFCYANGSLVQQPFDIPLVVKAMELILLEEFGQPELNW